MNKKINKKSQLALILSTLCLTPAVSAKNMYADIQVSEIEQSTPSNWIRKSPNTPRYPIKLAQKGITGCAVMTVNITESGESTGVKLIAASSKALLPREAKKLVKKMKWVPANKEMIAKEETKTVRLDFCVTGTSQQTAVQACKRQSKQVCSEA